MRAFNQSELDFKNTYEGEDLRWLNFLLIYHKKNESQQAKKYRVEFQDYINKGQNKKELVNAILELAASDKRLHNLNLRKK